MGHSSALAEVTGLYDQASSLTAILQAPKEAKHDVDFCLQKAKELESNLIAFEEMTSALSHAEEKIRTLLDEGDGTFTAEQIAIAAKDEDLPQDTQDFLIKISSMDEKEQEKAFGLLDDLAKSIAEAEDKWDSMLGLMSEHIGNFRNIAFAEKTKKRAYALAHAHESWYTPHLFQGDPRVDLPRKLSASSSNAPTSLRWDDASSSSSDEDGLLSNLSAIARKKENKTAGIALPADFNDCFPRLGRLIKKFCDEKSWEIDFVATAKLKAQGLVVFTEDADGILQTDRLSGEEESSLASLYAAIGCLFFRPEQFKKYDNAEVAITYACAIMARETLAKENPDLLKVALKNGDGGKAVFEGKLHKLCRTGMSAIKLVSMAVEKLLTKFARELEKDRIPEETQEMIVNRAFTSTDGMIVNCYRKSKNKVFENVEKINNRGKKVIERVEKEKIQVSVPDIRPTSMILTSTEVGELALVSSEFNNRKAVVEYRLSKIANPSILDKPKICLEVVAEAYAKLSPILAFSKQRRRKIRARALENATNVGNIPQTEWLKAESEVMASEDRIPESLIQALKWGPMT